VSPINGLAAVLIRLSSCAARTPPPTKLPELVVQVKEESPGRSANPKRRRAIDQGGLEQAVAERLQQDGAVTNRVGGAEKPSRSCHWPAILCVFLQRRLGRVSAISCPGTTPVWASMTRPSLEQQAGLSWSGVIAWWRLSGWL